MGLEKIKELKKQKGFTTKQLSELSGVPLGTVNKIISGTTKNPQLVALSAIANALGCSVEDFVDESMHLDSQKNNNYYLSDEVSKMAQEIHDNPELRILFDASRKLEKEDILTVVSLVKRMKGYNE